MTASQPHKNAPLGLVDEGAREPFYSAERALFRSQLWQVWCSPTTAGPIVSEHGEPAREATARCVLDAVPERMTKIDGEWTYLDETVAHLEARVQNLRDALFEVTHAVISETENHTFGKPTYDMTLDHLHDVATGARQVLYDD